MDKASRARAECAKSIPLLEYARVMARKNSPLLPPPRQAAPYQVSASILPVHRHIIEGAPVSVSPDALDSHRATRQEPSQGFLTKRCERC